MLLFFLRGVFVAHSLYCEDCARSEADNSAEIFRFDFRLYAPPLFLGILVLIQ